MAHNFKFNFVLSQIKDGSAVLAGFYLFFFLRKSVGLN